MSETVATFVDPSLGRRWRPRCWHCGLLGQHFPTREQAELAHAQHIVSGHGRRHGS